MNADYALNRKTPIGSFYFAKIQEVTPMNNTIPFNPTSRTVRTEQITVDVSICA